MSSANVSKLLGQYMLQGWVLTDDGCETCYTPLMRSPRGRAPESFCAKCDGGPIGSPTRIDRNIAASSSTAVATADTPSASPASSILQGKRSISGISTPPTDVSSLPDPEEEFVLPPPTEEMLARRAQSDFASAEIGRKLLQGWAMLADECPTSTCYGVPLLRPPRRLSNGSEGTTKECVVCKSIFVDAPDGSGLRLLHGREPTSSSASTSTPVERARGSTIVPQTSTNAAGSRDLVASVPTSSIQVLAQPSPPAAVAVPVSTQLAATPASGALTTNPTIVALESSLGDLTTNLTAASTSNPLNVARVGEVAQSITAVLTALEVARRVLA